MRTHLPFLASLGDLPSGGANEDRRRTAGAVTPLLRSDPKGFQVLREHLVLREFGPGEVLFNEETLLGVVS